MTEYTPQQFVDKWERAELKERASYQEHFMDLCRMVGHPTPAQKDPDGTFFTFEAGVKTTAGTQGYADVWYKSHFAIEYKGKGKYKTLDDAYQQLLRYRENLDNPPILIVCDIENWEIHTNFTGTAKVVHRFTNSDIVRYQRIRRMLRDIFYDPNRLHPERTAAEVTADAADVFKEIANNMREWDADPARIARFLTKLVFCLFAEDVGLLETASSGKGLFTEIVEQTRTKPADFVYYTAELFKAMAHGGKVLLRDVPYFNGNLFEDVQVETLSLEALTSLEKACHLDWSAVEPAIFGTLFERSLDPAKRAQLGAHYTSRDDIMLIVEPVLMQPLRREWDRIQAEAAPLREKYDAALVDGTRRQQKTYSDKLLALREEMLDQLRAVTVLDPACGSGNFLYVSLQLLLDLEKAVIHDPLWNDLPLAFPEVHPRQLYGIEINPIAHDLASIVAWIGFIQWRQNNGYLTFSEPILEPLDNVQQMDAILAFDDDGNPVEPAWPAVDVIVSNPPFLGDKKMRAELGDPYVDKLRGLYENKIPGQSDLVCYWFEQARGMIERGEVQRVGLLATNSIRGGANREVLNRIKQTGDIFMAWADREWILEGAAVRISMIGFDDGGEDAQRKLDGIEVEHINADLTGKTNILASTKLAENENLSFIGIAQHGPFSIDEAQARRLLAAQNNNSLSNSDVVVRWVNGLDITRRPRHMWIIDFGTDRTKEAAALYEAPFHYVKEHVYPIRSQNRRKSRRERWWLLGETMPAMRQALSDLDRYIGTPRVGKYRLFQFFDISVLPDNQVVVFARQDDYFFGVLHSKLHEVWALRMGTSLGETPRYTPTTTFETFPFPWSPGQEPVAPPLSPTTPTPGPSPIKREGSESAGTDIDSPPSAQRGGGVRGGGSSTDPLADGPDWMITPEFERAMTEIARRLRKNPTPSEAILWDAIRKRQLDGRKFRRQMPVGPFVVDFYCSSERLIVEVDGPIHESQREDDAQRQAMLESLGLRFVRVTADQVETDLPGVLEQIRAAFGYPAYAAISAAAQQLHAEREAWLNPPFAPESVLKTRTLTNLYNALVAYRADPKGACPPKIKREAWNFAPRLDALHRALDEAVCDAYGWPHDILDDEEEMLRRLLALNLERAG